MNTDLQTSKRFQPPKKRRDFLGLASLWSAGVALLIGLLGALRLPVPAVFPESNSRIKLGPLQDFEGTKVTWFPEYRLWVLFGRGRAVRHLGDLHAFGLHGRGSGGRRVLLPVPWEPIQPLGRGRGEDRHHGRWRTSNCSSPLTDNWWWINKRKSARRCVSKFERHRPSVAAGWSFPAGGQTVKNSRAVVVRIVELDP